MPTNRSPTLTPLAVAVLNLLVERPMHPYEMRVLMRDRGQHRVVRLTGPSIYDTIERLHRLGLAEVVETNREGRRPERTVYRITPAGRSAIREWVHRALAEPVPEYPRFAAALAFAAAVVVPDDVAPTELTAEAVEAGRREIISVLEQRAVRLEAEIAANEARLDAALARPNLPRVFLIEDEYGQAMRRAELAWVRQLASDIVDGDVWPTYESLMASLRAAAEAAMGGGEME